MTDIVVPSSHDLDSAIRDLAREMAPDHEAPMRLRLCFVNSVEQDMTCTVIMTADPTLTLIPGVRWLIDGYTPQAFLDQAAWMLDGGPGSRFLIGPTDMTSDARLPGWGAVQGLVPGGAPSIVQAGGWTDNILNADAGTYNQSPGGAGVVASITHKVWLNRGTYKFIIRHYGGTNLGIGEVFIDGVSIGTFDAYAAALATKVTALASTVTTYAPGYHNVKIQQTGTKNATSTQYFILFLGLFFGNTAFVAQPTS